MTSILELFKIGIGPSSSHTVGPMRAAWRFAQELKSREMLNQAFRVEAELFGSLALTGKGHGTDRAVILGLSGELPDLVGPGAIESMLAEIHEKKNLLLLGLHSIGFEPEADGMARFEIQPAGDTLDLYKN
jgi:L-serine dehydratase